MDACPSEDDLLALCRGTLAPDLRTLHLAHLDECDVCRRTTARLTDEEPATDAPATIGRYELREPIGAGAMGIVFAAYDPDLDRQIAIKLLRREHGEHGGDSQTGEPRLVREARALAKLAHPNVIAAYEVGRHDGDVYLAMELVDGGTLTSWLVAKQRSRREIVAAFVQAGEGLAAAHAAGIVHRDFKPDNVLVGTDGRIRVTDFGLASGGLTLGRSVPFDAGGVSLTRTGMLAGTPAYMAPEQLVGGAASERSDQFAWAVGLWTALFGVRPYAGDTVAALADAARAGTQQVVRGRDVPRGLRTALVRALAADPAARWPDMRAALEVVAPFAAPTRIRSLAIGGSVLAVAGTTVAVVLGGTREPAATCTVDARAIWDHPQREAVARVFAAASPGSKAIVATIDTTFARFQDRWMVARADACSLGAAGAARASCLDMQRVSAETLVRLFSTADASMVDRAVIAVANLPDPGTCSQPVAPVPPGKEGVARALEILLAQAQSLVGAQRFDEAEKLLAEITRTAEREGLLRIAALANLRDGERRSWTTRDAQVRIGREVLAVATRLGDRSLTFEALLALTFTHGQRGDHALADFLDEHAVQVAATLGDPPAPLATLAVGRCQRSWQRGTPPPSALEVCADARRRTVAAHGEDDYRVAEVDTEAGNVAFMLGRYDDAIALYRRSVQGFERLFGADTTRTLAPLGNLAEAFVRQGRPADAVPLFEQLLAKQPNGSLWDGLGQARRALADHAGALEAFGRSAEAGAAMGLPSVVCGGRVGEVEELLALGRGSALPAALARADEVCGPLDLTVERARLAFARAQHRDAIGDHRGVEKALAEATSLVAGAAADSPGARLAAELATWQRTHRR